MKIAYLGPKGSFSEKATAKLFPNEELIELQSIRNVIESIEQGIYEKGVIPLENFYNGIVMPSVDSLTECKKTKIIDEIELGIVHCIGALGNSTKISKIFSHPQALEQCAKYISEKYPNAQTIAVESTAKAAELIKKDNLSDCAAIASKSAIDSNGLVVLDEDILPNNTTRFAVISFEKSIKTDKNKTLVSIHPKIDKSGILFNILKFIADKKINIKHIHSRPDGKGGYYFVLELDGHKDDQDIQIAFKNIREFLEGEENLKVLGSYPNRNGR